MTTGWIAGRWANGSGGVRGEKKFGRFRLFCWQDRGDGIYRQYGVNQAAISVPMTASLITDHLGFSVVD